MAEIRRRIELVESPSDQANESLRVGLGLLIGLGVGRESLIAAATGTEQIEFAIAHFVFVVLVSVGGLLFAGSLHDRYRERARLSAALAAAQASSESGRGIADEPASSANSLPPGPST